MEKFGGPILKSPSFSTGYTDFAFLKKLVSLKLEKSSNLGKWCNREQKELWVLFKTLPQDH